MRKWRHREVKNILFPQLVEADLGSKPGWVAPNPPPGTTLESAVPSSQSRIRRRPSILTSSLTTLSSTTPFTGDKGGTMHSPQPEREPCKALNPLQLYFLSIPQKIKIAECLLFSLSLCSRNLLLGSDPGSQLSAQSTFLQPSYFWFFKSKIRSKKKKKSGRSGLCCNVMSQQKSLATGPTLGSCHDRRRLGDVLRNMWGAQGYRQPLTLELVQVHDRVEWRQYDTERRGTHSQAEEWTIYRSDFELGRALLFILIELLTQAS